MHRHASRARTPRSPLRTAGSQAQPQPGPHCLTRVTAREFLVVSAVSATANTHRHAMHSRTRATPILDNSRNAQGSSIQHTRITTVGARSALSQELLLYPVHHAGDWPALNAKQMKCSVYHRVDEIRACRPFCFIALPMSSRQSSITLRCSLWHGPQRLTNASCVLTSCASVGRRTPKRNPIGRSYLWSACALSRSTLHFSSTYAAKS